MKTISILFFALMMMSTTIAPTQTEVLKATYDGYEDEIYYFSDEEDTYEFKNIDSKLIKTYDLTSEKFEGRDFNITYLIEKKIDEDDEETEIWTISKLELIEE